MADNPEIVGVFSPPTEFWTLENQGMGDDWFEVTGFRAYSLADAEAEAMKQARANASTYRVLHHTGT